jgi:pimeloyl-ACP methyl ester carboxylesterase
MIPSLDFGGAGQDLWFLHANGYPPDCYRPLLGRLSETFRVRAMLQRPLWPGSDPLEIDDWLPLSTDLIGFLDQQQALPIMAVGHSLGAIVILRAALRSPELFRSVVLIEPVLFLPSRIREWGEMRTTGQADRLPLVLQARNRRQSFDDLERLFEAYRGRQNFRYLDDSALRILIKALTCPSTDGTYRLCYSAAWEERIYLTGIWRDMDIWTELPSLRVPTLIIGGDETDTFLPEQAQEVVKVQPATRIATVEKATHLVPMERPDEVGAIILDFLS